MKREFTDFSVVHSRSRETDVDGDGGVGETQRRQTQLDFYEEWGPQPDPQQAFREMILKTRRGMEAVRDQFGRL